MHTRPLPDASPSIQGIGLNQLLDVPSLGVLQVVLLEVGQSFLGFCEVAWPIAWACTQRSDSFGACPFARDRHSDRQ